MLLKNEREESESARWNGNTEKLFNLRKLSDGSILGKTTQVIENLESDYLKLITFKELLKYLVYPETQTTHCWLHTIG